VFGWNSTPGSPQNPGEQKLKQFNDLTPEEKRAFNGRPRG
jgi:hypothetical protein